MKKPSINFCASLPRLLTGLALAAFAPAALSAQLLVTSPYDLVTYGDGCSLREALINANTDSKSGSIECARGSGADVIVVQPGAVGIASLRDDESDPNSGDLEVTSVVTVLGASGTSSTLLLKDSGRAFDVHPGGHLVLDGVGIANGAAPDGGAVRVQSGGIFEMRNALIRDSRTLEGDIGRGGAIYVAGGGTAIIERSSLVMNLALGITGDGGGVYCDSNCSLTMSDVSVAENQALGMGGGIYIGSAATVDLRYLSVGFNVAADGAGIFNAGDLTLFATALADSPGGEYDLACVGGSVTPLQPVDGVSAPVPGNFIVAELLDPACPGTGIETADTMTVPSTTGEVFYGIRNNRFNGPPSTILESVEAYGAYLRNVIPADALDPVTGDPLCAGHKDQHERVMADGVACDLGAMQESAAIVSKMSDSLDIGATGVFQVALETAPLADATMQLVPVSGVGESCNPAFSVTINFVAGSILGSGTYDADQIFNSTGLNRPNRACILTGTLPSNPAAFGAGAAGASVGRLVVVVNSESVTTRGIAVPEVGTYLDFGFAPVGSGGTGVIHLQPTQTDWVINDIQLLPPGGDADRFELISPTLPIGAPIPVPSGAGGGYDIHVRCKPGQVGDYDAEIMVSTNYGDLSWGLRCTVAHLASFGVDRSVFTEGGAFNIVRATVSLDSPNVLGPQTFTITPYGISEVLGALLQATPDVDFAYVDGADAAPADSGSAVTVTIPTGASQATVRYRIVDEFEVEKITEGFGLRLEQPVADYVEAVGQLTREISIVDNDREHEEVEVSMTGLLPRVAAGIEVSPTFRIANLGRSDLAGLNVRVTAGAPMKILSFVLPGAVCEVEEEGRTAYCQMSHDVLPAKPFGAPADYTGNQVVVSGVLLTAAMDRPPQVDYPASLVVTASATTNVQSVSARLEQEFVIAGKNGSGGGGAVAPGVWTLMVSLLLACRQWRGISAGRRARRTRNG